LKPTTQSILIAGGRVLDPIAKVDALMDVFLRDGQVAEVAAPEKSARNQLRPLMLAG